MRKKKSIIAALAVLTLVPLSGCSNVRQQDPWFNRTRFEEGTYYFQSIEGFNNNEAIVFDESSYFVCTPLTEEENDAYEDLIDEEAPNGLWWGPGDPNDFQIEWFNCYFANMPSLNFFSWTVDGQGYHSTGWIGKTGEMVHDQWYYDYQSLYDEANRWVNAYIELHEENEVLTEVRMTLWIQDVCELVVYFSFVAA